MQSIGYISQNEAENIANKRAVEAVKRIESIKPGDELIKVSRICRKYGFKIVYALGDDNTLENTEKLVDAISDPAAHIDGYRITNQLLPNIKVVNNISLIE
ncbi:MAG: hypothetical protein JKY42_11710 [Flavobacteriales bacterium]|nr:hypothetical protein [Flavobacteriales bacterium]